MYVVYSFLLGLGFLILFPKLVLDALRHGKYISGLSERLGSLEPSANKNTSTIWLHCVSVGEVQAALPLVSALRSGFPECDVSVSTVTITGQKLAREIFRSEAVRVFYFPIDWRWSVRRVLNVIQPSLVLLMETELWPNFLKECHRRSIPVAVVNGRLSEGSFRRYHLVSSFIKKVVNNLDLALMQTDSDAERIRNLGLAAEKVVVCGNIKFDSVSSNASAVLTNEFAARFGFDGSCEVIVAASTHEPEESVVLESFKLVRASHARAPRLVIAPRHPERFDAVASLLKKSGLSWSRRSGEPAKSDRDADIILFDSIGELRALFPLASVVLMGGSIAPVGGHNILEPAAAGVCIVTGPHMENFDEVIKKFHAKDAVVQIQYTNGAVAGNLAETIRSLLNDPDKRRLLAEHAKALIDENRGATSCYLQHIRTLVSRSSR